MGHSIEQYLSSVQNLLATIEQDQIEKAAEILAETIKNDKLIYVLGTGGHSCMAAEDMFWRAGGLAAVKPIFPSGFALAHGARRSTIMERTPNYISAVLEHEAPGPGDTLIVVNAYGINRATIEAALKGKELGATIIAVTSKVFGDNIPKDHPARHATGQNLSDLKEVDLVIDNKMPADDGVLAFDSLDVKVSPVSTILNSFILQALVGCTVEKLLSQGIQPPVWKSANLPGGDEYNRQYLRKYAQRIKKL